MTDQLVLKVDGLTALLVRSQRKTLSLEINQGGLKIRAPAHMREAAITEFIQQKRDWIKKHLAQQPMPQTPLNLVTGAQILLRGENITLKIQANQRGPVQLINNCLALPVIASHLPQEVSVKNKLIKWYKQLAQTELNAQVLHYAQLMQLSPIKQLPKETPDQQAILKVRDYKRRWGSCDQLGHLSFNWRIIMAPSEVLEYVVVHELAHRYEFNHSKQFWKLVECQLPDWRTHQHWLQHHGMLLYRF